MSETSLLIMFALAGVFALGIAVGFAIARKFWAFLIAVSASAVMAQAPAPDAKASMFGLDRLPGVSALTGGSRSLREAPPAAIKRIPWVPESVVAALEDCGQVNPLYQPSTRYIWCPPWMPPKTPQIVSGVVNLALSRSEVIYRPVVASVKGGGCILRIDTSALASNAAELENMQVVFGSLAQQNKYYNVTINGFTSFGAHTGIRAMAELASRTQSQNPIVRADFFVEKALTTLNGGKYYAFQGIDKNPKGKTAQQAWFESLGATEKDLDATQRILVRHSEVAGHKWRRVDLVHATKTRPGAATGDVFLTHDITNEEQGAFDSNPARNLIEFKDAAREAIGFKTNGLQQYALFKSDGSLQDSAPENVVQDGDVPNPFTKQLQAGISCVRCHSRDKADGYKDLVNDAPRLFGGKLDNFGDLSQASKRDASQQVQLLVGLYAMRPTKPLSRARDDYQESLWNATGGLSVKEFGEGVSAIFAARDYQNVTPRQFLLELGVVASEQEATEILNRVIPKLPPAEDGISPEDPDLGALREGGTLVREDADAVFADAAFRMQANE